MSRRAFPALVSVCFVLSLAAGSAHAQGGESVPLSLDEALSTALANNLQLVSAKKDPLIAEQQVEVNRAPFDGVVGASAGFNRVDTDETIVDNTSAASTPPVTSKSEVPAADVSFNHLLTFGANYSLTYNYQDVDAAQIGIEPATGFLTSSTFAQTTQGFSLVYQMPLLLGFGKEVNLINLTLARSGLDISREDLRLAAMLTLNDVEDAYWDVLAAREALRIARLSLERAQDLLELNRKKVEVGTLAPIEITQAEAGVASQEEGVIVAETTLENAEDTLLRLMAIPEDSLLWGQSLQLTDRPSYDPLAIDLDDAIETGLEHRPEIVIARQELRNSELSERVARKNTRHTLNLEAAIRPATQEDTERLVEILQPAQPNPSDTTTDSESTDWRVGLLYSYPLRNRRAKASYAIARLTTEKGVAAVQQAEQTIRVDVRVAARNVESGVQRVEAARKNVELQQKKLDAEQKKFENGMSTSFEVLTFQNDLANAELAEIRAKLDYVKALAAFDRATGTLLEARGLQIGS